MMQTQKGLILIAVVGLLLIGILWYTKNNEQGASSPTPSPTSQQSSPLPSGMTAEENDLRAGGSSYRDPKGVFLFLYPNEYTLDTQNDGQFTRIYKRGVQERPQSEMTDGVIMVFESIDLGDKTLSEWIDASIAAASADGTSEVVEPKTAVTVNGYNGYTYTLHSLGESKYLVLQKDANSKNAVSVAMAVMDPQNKGYQAEVNATIKTLQLLK